MHITRRMVLLMSVALLTAMILPAQQTQFPAASNRPDQAPVTYFTLKPLGHNVWAGIAIPGSGAGSNAGFIIGEAGVLVVDTYQRADAARAMLAEIRKLTPLPVKYVVNTHYHIDHVTGNGVYAEAGATIFAHKNVRDWILKENLKFYGANITPAQRASVEALTGPTEVYADNNDHVLLLGSRRVIAHFFPGHTGGDTVVFDSESNVVFCGDLFWRHTLPNLIDASTQAWIDTLATLTQAHPAAAFVSGHGEVGTADDVNAFRGYLVDLRQYVTEGRAAGKTGDALVDYLLPKMKDKYGEWSAFNNFAKRNILDTDAELAGTKKIPQPAAGQ